MAKRVSKLWEVRNASGQYVGTYCGCTEQEAIAQFDRYQAQHASTFKKSAARISSAGFTATVQQIDPVEQRMIARDRRMERSLKKAGL